MKIRHCKRYVSYDQLKWTSLPRKYCLWDKKLNELCYAVPLTIIIIKFPRVNSAIILKGNKSLVIHKFNEIFTSAKLKRKFKLLWTQQKEFRKYWMYFKYDYFKGAITLPLTQAVMSGPLTRLLNSLCTHNLCCYYTVKTLQITCRGRFWRAFTK